MAAFDLNSLYFLKNAAPKTSSFEEMVAPMGKGFELGRAYGENYRQNSLRNLIEQREKEGIPYDRLSNEAAKYDLGVANTMRNERRSSLEYNYKQSVAEFEHWRKNMARRICGLILQKGDELNIPMEDFERVLEVAASYVATYDEALAQWLLGQAQARRYNRARLNKPATQKPPSYKDLLNKAQIAKEKASAFDSRLNKSQYWGLMNYALAAEAVAEREGQVGVPAEYNDVLRLLRYFKRDNEIDKKSIYDFALSDKFRLINEGGVNDADADFSGIVTPDSINVQNGQGSAGTKENDKANSVVKKRFTSSVSVNNGENGDMVIKSMLKGVGKAGQYPYIDNTELKKYIDYSDKIEDNDSALKFLEDVKLQLTNDSNDANKGSAKTEGADKNYFDLVNKKIEERKSLKNGGYSPKTAMILKLNGKSTSERNEERARWLRIPTIIDGYYTAAGALLPPLVRALLPEERTTDQDVARVLVTDLGENGFNKLKNAIAASDNETLGSLLKQEAFEQAVRNVAPVVMNKIKGEYRGLVNSNKGNKDLVNKALIEAYNFDDNVISYLDGRKAVQTNKTRYEAIQKKKREENEKIEREAFEREMGNDSGSNYSVEDML